MVVAKNAYRLTKLNKCSENSIKIIEKDIYQHFSHYLKLH
jgi:hypothetical protein